jgi:adenosylcobinamide-phosphate synthase
VVGNAAGWPQAAGLIGGVLADALLGDPRRGHPVAAFGRIMTAVERAIYADGRLCGAAFTASGVALAVVPALAAGPVLNAVPASACRMRDAGLGRGAVSVLTGSRPRRRPAGAAVTAATTGAVTAAATWAVTGARSLCAEAVRIGRALESGDLDRARELLPNLCGRDPAYLDEPGICRAVVESVAENTSDAIVAPLLWGALAGPAGLTGYRAVNTMDAMVGHHSPRYERFGWASARLDDVANWGPARLTALLAAACAPVVGGRPAPTWRIALEYGSHHPSPNAGWCEAAFAGALDIRLGGPLSYAGRSEHRPFLGTGRLPESTDIARAVRLCRAVTVATTASTALLAAPPRRSRRAPAR